MSFPVARESDGVRGLFEPAVAQQFRVQAELDVLEHEFGELPVEARADAVLDLRRVDGDAGRVAGLTARRCDEQENGYRQGEGDRFRESARSCFITAP
jgi:hypothetical protein